MPTIEGSIIERSGRDVTIEGGPWHKFIGCVLVVLFALLASAPATAQLWYLNDWPQQKTVAQIGTCTSRLDGGVQNVRDALTVNTCATGGGTANVLCICDGGAWRVLGASAPAGFTVADAAGDTTTFPVLAGAATGALVPLSDPGLTYQATTNALTATTFIGALTGAVTGNVTGDVTGNVTGNLTGTASLATLATTATTANGVPISDTAPTVCDVSTSLGFLYVDTTGPDLCYCPGAAGWLPVDGSGTCA